MEGCQICVVPTFRLPSAKELEEASVQERMNIFRRYFASSRYSRLLIQQMLVRTALDKSLSAKVKKMESDHNRDFVETIKAIKKSGYLSEFLAAVKEEDEALQKIIEAYDNRMSRT